MSRLNDYRQMLKDIALNMDATNFHGKPIDEMNDGEIREALLILYDNDLLTPDGRKTVEYMQYLMTLSKEEVLSLTTSHDPS